MAISEQLKKRRIELQLSQEAAADKAGISRRTLAYYESGERIPNAENLLILCNLYGLNVNELITSDISLSEKQEAQEIEEQPAISNDTLDKLEAYLTHQQAKKDFFRKGVFYAAMIISIFIVILLLIVMIMKIVLMNYYDYDFSQAAASMWTSLFEALITFVNDPNVTSFPIVSVSILSIIVLAWLVYFLVKIIKKKRQK